MSASAPCPFCALAIAGADEDLVAWRTPNAYVLPAPRQRPRNRGHMLILPNRHVTRLVDVEADLLAELYGLAGRVSMAVRPVFRATGATIFQNDDSPDQVLLHLHVHVVPRRDGDDFRMPDPVKDELSRDERVDQGRLVRRRLGGIVDSIETGPSARGTEKQRFLDLVERYATAKDPREQERLREELARVTFGE